MRYSLIFPLLLFFVWSCTPEKQEDQEHGPKDLRSISLSLASDSYYGSEKYSGHLYLSNENGEVVDQVVLINNTSAELIMDYDSNSAFDLTMADRHELRQSNEEFISYRLKTFSSIEAHNFEIKEPQISYAEAGASAFLNITNTGGQIRNIVTGNYYNRNLSETEANFEIYLIHKKEDIYISFRPQGEDRPRYILLEDVENGFTTDYALANLPLAEDQVVINYPQTDALSVSIWGAVESEPNNFFALLSQDIKTINPPYSIHYIPIKEFVQFKQSTRLGIGNKLYSKIEINSIIPTEFSIPDLDFQIINSVNDAYEFSPKTSFDYYSISMYYLNEAEKYEIIWDLYGKSTNESIKIRYPKILETLGPEKMPNSVNDFKLYRTEIMKAEGVDSYLEYCNIVMDPNLSLEKKGSKIESMKIEQQ
jgi:hypothetical protein